MTWINNEDNRRFITQISFVIITLGLLVYLNSININGEYKELIVGIIGIFIGVASIAAKDLISGQSISEIKELRQRLNVMEMKVIASEKEKEIYKEMFNKINDKLVEQSGILHKIKEKK